MVITLYILMFVPEKNKAQVEDSAVGGDEEEEVEILPSQVPSILKDIAYNKHTITFVMFLIATCACNSIDSNVSQVYMTNDLKFSRESLSLVKVVSAPANIVCAILSSYLSSAKPFKFFYYTTCWCMFMSCYSIFVLLRTFPSDPLEQQSPFNIFHVTAVILLTDLAQNFWFTTVFFIVA